METGKTSLRPGDREETLQTLQTAQEGEKTPRMSRLTFHLTSLAHSDRDVI